MKTPGHGWVIFMVASPGAGRVVEDEPKMRALLRRALVEEGYADGEAALALAAVVSFLPHAFDRSTRADTARTGSGTGLGLAIAAAVTTSANGTYYAINHPDGGAEITLAFPTPRRDRPGNATPTAGLP